MAPHDALMNHRVTALIGLVLSVASAADCSWTWGPPVAQTQERNIDGSPAVLKVGADVWYLYTSSVAEGPRKTTEILHRYKGTSMDNLTAQPNASFDSWDRPHGDDHYWLVGGIWADPADGTWYATIHCEFFTGIGPWCQRQIRLATSKDLGLTWKNEGLIWTSDTSTNFADHPGDRVDCGIGDQRLFIDRKHGYAYIFGLHYNVLKTNSADRQHRGVVARCALADKLRPGAWRQWYDGGWKSDCLGGKHDFVFDGALGSAFYSTYLGTYVYMYDRVTGPGTGDCVLRTCDDLALQKWSDPVRLCDYHGGFQWYGMVVDETCDNFTVGANFRFYSASNGVEEGTRYNVVTSSLVQPPKKSP